LAKNLEKVPDKSEYIVNLGDNVDIAVGDTSTETFQPTIEWSKWYGEINFKLTFPMTITAEVETFANGMVEVTVGWITYRTYVLQNGKDDVLEIELDIDRKQVFQNPYLEFDFEYTPGVRFVYQPTLEDEYAAITNPDVTLEQFLAEHQRPENVVGSYAVYWNKRDNEYKTGKICHLFAWEAIDSNGDRLHCPLEFTEISPGVGKLRIVGDSDWLKNAAYPVKLMGKGDTLGLTSQGASWQTFVDDAIQTHDSGAAGSGGALATIHAWFQTGRTGKLCLYDDDGGGNPDALCDYTAEGTTATNNWTSWNQTQGYSVVNGTTYHIGGWIDGGDDAIAYDADAGEARMIYDVRNYALGTFPNPSEYGGGTGAYGFYSFYITWGAASSSSSSQSSSSSSSQSSSSSSSQSSSSSSLSVSESSSSSSLSVSQSSSSSSLSVSESSSSSSLSVSESSSSSSLSVSQSSSSSSLSVSESSSSLSVSQSSSSSQSVSQSSSSSSLSVSQSSSSSSLSVSASSSSLSVSQSSSSSQSVSQSSSSSSLSVSQSSSSSSLSVSESSSSLSVSQSSSSSQSVSQSSSSSSSQSVSESSSSSSVSSSSSSSQSVSSSSSSSSSLSGELGGIIRFQTDSEAYRIETADRNSRFQTPAKAYRFITKVAA